MKTVNANDPNDQACDPDDVALKSFFLGPQSENSKYAQEEFSFILDHFLNWKRSLFSDDGHVISEHDQVNSNFKDRRDDCRQKIEELMRRFSAETPKHSPRYIGHMVSENLLPAIYGHFAAMLYNPNNTSFESSKVGLQIEREAIAHLRKMVGFEDRIAGHFTSGGTIANFEAIWRARYRFDCCFSMAHYLTKEKKSSVNLFKMCQLGWESFHHEMRLNHLTLELLRPYSLFSANPYSTISSINSVLENPFLGPVVLVAAHKHFSWTKGVSLFGLGADSLWEIELDPDGRASADHLSQLIEKAESQNRPILMVIGVAGTTELGTFDPLDRFAEILKEKNLSNGADIWFHIDAAYGGYFRTISGNEYLESFLPQATLRALAAFPEAHSITIDPHKLGYVPYSCGAILIRNENDYQTDTFAAPYLLSKGKSPGPWSKTIEGSRGAFGAAATWMCAETVGLDCEGYGRILGKTIDARTKLESLLKQNIQGFYAIPTTGTNILCFVIAKQTEPTSKVNQRTQKIYSAFEHSLEFSVSQTTLSIQNCQKQIEKLSRNWRGSIDCDSLNLIRIVVMNPFFGSKEGAVNYLLIFKKELDRILNEFF